MRLLLEASSHRQDTIVFNGDSMSLQYIVDTAPNDAFAMRMRNEADHAKARKNGMQHVGHIPNIIIEKWLKEYGINALKKEHLPAVIRLLNSPDWKWLKCTYETI